MGLKTRIQGFGLPSTVIDEDENVQKQDNSIEKPKPDFAPLSLKVLSSLELAFKESIHSKLLDILDLSLISGIEDKEARKQIRAVAQ